MLRKEAKNKKEVTRNEIKQISTLAKRVNQF